MNFYTSIKKQIDKNKLIKGFVYIFTFIFLWWNVYNVKNMFWYFSLGFLVQMSKNS